MRQVGPGARLAFGGLCAIAVLHAAPAASDDLGRLFFTPERRAVLERARQSNIREQPQVAEDNLLSINGLVRRSSGKRTVWVNGTPINENSVTPLRGLGAPARIRRRGDPAAPPIPVGTTLNRNTGERRDALNGGAIKVRPDGSQAK